MSEQNNHDLDCAINDECAIDDECASDERASLSLECQVP